MVLHSLGTILDFQRRLSEMKRLSCETLSLCPLIGDFFGSCEVGFLVSFEVQERAGVGTLAHLCRITFSPSQRQL